MQGASGSTTTPTDVEHTEWAEAVSTPDADAVGEPIVPLGIGSVMSPGPGESTDLTAATESAAKEPDGRSLRRSRNRTAVITSLLQLIDEGSLDPSVPDIADRAGVSHRSVFRYFDDINDLVRLAINQAVQDAMPLRTITDLGIGTVERRIDVYVDTRLRVHSNGYAVGRVARIKAPKIPALEEGLQALTLITRAQMAEHFAIECDLSPDREFLLDALMVLTSFEAYDYQRRLLGHGTERIRQVWHSSLAAQLTPVAVAE